MRRLVLLALLATSNLLACGQTGPQGPQGEQGPAGPPGPEGPPGPGADAIASDGDLGDTSGDAGDDASDASTDAADASDAAASVVATLASTTLSSTDSLEVLSIGFGAIATPSTTPGTAGKVQYEPVSVTVRPGPLAILLTKKLLSGSVVDPLTLTLLDATGAKTGTITLRNALVTAHTDAASGDYTESFAFVPQKLSLQMGATTLDLAIAMGTGAACVGAPCCAGSAPLGPFEQGDASWPLAKSAVRADAVTIGEVVPVTSGTGGAGAGKPQISSFAIESNDEETALCALGKLSMMTPLPLSTIAVESPLSTSFAKPLDQTTWTLCSGLMSAHQLRWSSSGFSQDLQITPNAFVEVENAIDPTTGAVSASPPVGWSTASSAPITACP